MYSFFYKSDPINQIFGLRKKVGAAFPKMIITLERKEEA